jgi:hypothetical protein
MERTTAKHRFHSTIDLVEWSTSGHSSKPLKSRLTTKVRSSKGKKSDNIDILKAKPKDPLDSDSAFEKKSSESTKVRSSTDKAKGSDRSKQGVANAKISSALHISVTIVMR